MNFWLLNDNCLMCRVSAVMLVVVLHVHAESVASEEKCIIPECRRKRFSEGSVVHYYCSKSHADEGRKRGIYRKLGLTAI